MIFENDSPEVHDKFLTLLWALDGTQPCVKDPDMFTENWTGRPIPDDVAERACAGCKFTEQCLDYAVEADEQTGIWGGTSPDKRRRMKNE